MNVNVRAWGRIRAWVLALLLPLAGCGYYSFTGATVAPHLGTVAIPLFEDLSTSPLNDLDDRLTELLIDRFVGQTRLALATSETDADALLTGRITRYTNEPTSVGGDERATRNRVTITVSVRYQDQVEDAALLERSFTGTAEYDPVAEGLDGERLAAEAALDNLADDIFTAATSDW